MNKILSIIGIIIMLILVIIPFVYWISHDISRWNLLCKYWWDYLLLLIVGLLLKRYSKL